MAAILTAEDVVRRIAGECPTSGVAVGIRLEPAAAIVRQYGEQFRRAPRRQRRPRQAKPPPPVLIYSVERWLLFGPNFCKT